jgi:hypothetical protein
MKVLNDFRDFALRGNVLDLAVGIIIGAAFYRKCRCGQYSDAYYRDGHWRS